MKRALIGGALLLALTAVAAGQILTLGVGGGGFNSTPLVACNAGQLDFSDATGCNTTQYMVLLK